MQKASRCRVVGISVATKIIAVRFFFFLAECPNRGIDLAFILDSSGSVGQRNFDLEKQLVSDIVDRFSIGSNATQVAVISYSGFARINFRLDNFTTRQAVQQAVDAVEYFDIAG